jgi:hypothetical protein
MQAKFSFQQRNSIVATILVQKGKSHEALLFLFKDNKILKMLRKISEKKFQANHFFGRNF